MLSLFCPNPVQNNENVQPLFMYTAHNDTYFRHLTSVSWFLRNGRGKMVNYFSDDLSERENKTP